jgi:hypothetical protein
VAPTKGDGNVAFLFIPAALPSLRSHPLGRCYLSATQQTLTEGE